MTAASAGVAAARMRLRLPGMGGSVALMLNGFGVHRLAVEAWNRASHRVCADGALRKVAALGSAALPPTHVVGDMDSRGDTAVLDGVSVVRVGCQDTTDFEKCLAYIENTLGYTGDVVTGFALGGRLDHEHTNFRVALNRRRGCRVVLVGDGQVACPLQAGTTVVEREGMGAAPVALLPLLGPATVSTSGLRWDLEGAVLGYGAEYAWTSSNEFAEEEATVVTDVPLLWTAMLE